MDRFLHTNEKPQDPLPSLQEPSSPLAAVPAPKAPSPVRAWVYLVYLSFQRQARAHWMVWIAVGLLALALLLVYLNTQAGRWTFAIFSRGVVLSLYTSFLLPLWSLSFATEALGREREA